MNSRVFKDKTATILLDVYLENECKKWHLSKEWTEDERDWERSDTWIAGIVAVFPRIGGFWLQLEWLWIQKESKHR